MEGWVSASAQVEERMGRCRRVGLGDAECRVELPVRCTGQARENLESWIEAELLGIVEKAREVLTCEDQTGG